MKDAASELERLLDPISPAAFLSSHWERKPLHIRGRADKFESLGFTRAFLWESIRALPEDARCLRAIYHDAQGVHREIIPIAPRLAPQLFDSGMTIVFTELEDHCANIAALTRGLRAALDLPGHITVGCFFSPRAHGAGLHYDNHSAIVLQLEGKKRWRISPEPALAYPPANYGYESDDALRARNAREPDLETRLPDRSRFLDVELVPGDVLYMPPGTWHEPRATDEGGSLALTLGPFVKSALQLVNEQLARGLGRRLEWRRSVPVGLASRETPAEVEEFFEARLAELKDYVARLDASSLARLYHAHVAPPRMACKETLAREQRPVAPSDRFVLDRARRVSATRGGDDEKIYLYVDGDEIDLPATAGAFVETLLAKDSFAAAEAREWVQADEEPYDWDDVKTILEVLASRGLILRTP